MFYLNKNFNHAGTCSCNRCDAINPAIWAADSVLFSMDPKEGSRVLKFDGETREPDDPFIVVELQLAALLATTYGQKTIEVEEVIRKGLEAPFRQRNLDEALDKAQAIMGAVIDPFTRFEIATRVNELITKGAKQAVRDVKKLPDPPADPTPTPDPIPTPDSEANNNALLAGVLGGATLTAFASGGTDEAAPPDIIPAEGTILEGSPSTQLVMDGIVDAANYYTNEHFNTYIIPTIQDRVQMILDGTDPTDVPDFADLEELISTRLKSVPYWRVVANAAASRAYHYGYMKAGQIQGVRSYSIVAVLDDRTSEICLDLDGRVFWIADATSLMERVASSEDPEAAATMMPWIPSAVDMDNNELRDMGCMVPPFHGNCRSTIEYIYS